MVIKNVKKYTENGNFEDAEIYIEGERFAGSVTEDASEPVIDGEGAYALPGLIDLHFHGCIGADFCDGSRETLEKISAYEASVGVTTIAPATMTLPTDELEQILATGARTVKIIKPHREDEVIYHKIRHAVEHGAFAVGMDIDHCFAGNGEYDVVCGLPMHAKTASDLENYVKASSVPFIVKGVLSAKDAEKCVKAGVSGILVSHHHGIMQYAVPPLMILPEIVKAVDGQIPVFVDCGIESGMDVFKALALGADAVCVGRELMGPLKDGAAGVTNRMNEMNRELMSIMARTGAKSLKEIDPSVIHYRHF